MMDDTERLFSLCNLLAMAGWALLLFLPRRWKWPPILSGLAIPVALGVLYGALMLSAFTEAEGGGYGTLSQVRALFSIDRLLLAGWVHYLAFDLVVATVIARHADRAGVSRLVQTPILIMTFMFGPLGLVLYVATAAGWRALARPAAQGAESAA